MKGRRIYSSATDSFAILPQRPSPKADPQGPGKTVSLAVSRAQSGLLAAAIANWRAVQTSLKAKQQVSRGVLFTTLADTQRRKRLRKKVLVIT